VSSPVEALVHGPAETDSALLELVAGGDRAALGRLYDRYAPALVAAALRTLRSQGDAEDVLHDVFVEVWQQAGDYDARRGSVRAWLFLRLRSRALDRVRRASARDLQLDGEMAAALPSLSVEDPALGPDRERVRRALEALPAEQRSALVLAWFCGLSGAQIAERLSAPLGTIKTRLALGMSKLRAALGAEVRR
jgi:RNA polymerase sigma-70 factor (ECF subfamily)